MTNDGATILKQIEVEHPAAKVLVELAQLQDEEVSDRTLLFFFFFFSFLVNYIQICMHPEIASLR